VLSTARTWSLLRSTASFLAKKAVRHMRALGDVSVEKKRPGIPVALTSSCGGRVSFRSQTPFRIVFNIGI
jgi:hypothetical protein